MPKKQIVTKHCSLNYLLLLEPDSSKICLPQLFVYCIGQSVCRL